MSGSENKQAATLTERLAAAQLRYDSGDDDKATESALALLADLPAEGFPELRDDAVLLALFSSARARNFEGGWRLVERYGGPAASPDFCYAACYLAYRRADGEATAQWGQRFLEQYALNQANARHVETRSKRHEIFNTLGCAARDGGDDRLAVALLVQAVQVAPAWPLSYLNLAQMACRAGDLKLARQYIEQGVSACGEIEELRMFARSIPAEPRITLCMIVKDEEDMLPGALESVQGVVDEIVVVDTGSTDRTVEIALSFRARVYHHTWEDDFSAARNLSIGYATGDWVLILDADERLDSATAPLVRKIATGCMHEAVSFSVYNIDLDDDRVSFLPAVRMFKNGRGYGYTGIVHNQINLPAGCPVLCAEVSVHHFGYTPSIAEARGKFERTTALLRKQLEENPDDAFAHFNMAQILRGGGQAKACAGAVIEHARCVIERIKPGEHQHRHVLLMAYHQLASSYFLLEDYERAERACREALSLKPDFIDGLMTLGHVLLNLKRYDEAREVFLGYLRARQAYRASDEAAGFILLNIENQHEAHYGLGQIEEVLGEYSRALEWFGKVLEAREDYRETYLRVGQIAARLGRWREAESALAAELRHRPHSFWGHFCMGNVHVQSGRWEAAYEQFQAAHRIRPDHPELPLNLTTVALKLGLTGDAIRWLGLVSPELAQHPTVKRSRAEVALVSKDYAAARIDGTKHPRSESPEAPR